MAILYNKYRPKKYQDVFSQETIVQTLKNAVLLKKTGQAYLFTGPRGTGKTTLARIFSKSINCLNLDKTGEPCNKCKNCLLIERKENLDIMEIDAASHTGVDNIRALQETLHIAPSILKYKVYIIDEVHMLSKGAFNALLKSLEEPPEFVIFILATTEIHKVPATIISRCQRFAFKQIPHQAIQKKIKKIAKKEGIILDEASVNQIAISAEGGLRDAESLLSQIINLSKKAEVSFQEVKNILGIPDLIVYFQLIDNLCSKNLRQCLEIIIDYAYGTGDMDNFLDGLINYLRYLLLFKINENEAEIKEKFLKEDRLKLKELADKLSVNEIGRIISQFIQSKSLMKITPIPQLPLELAILNLLAKELEHLDLQFETASFKKNTLKINQNVESDLMNQDQKIDVKLDLKKESVSSEKKLKILKKEINIDVSQEQKSVEKVETKKKENNLKEKIQKLSLNQLMQAWEDILISINQKNASLSGILRNCEIIEMEEEGIIKMKVKHKFHKQLLEDPKNLQILSRAFQEKLDLDCKFCYLLDKDLNLKSKEEKNRISPENRQLLDEFQGEII